MPLDLRVVDSSPTMGTEIREIKILKKKKNKVHSF